MGETIEKLTLDLDNLKNAKVDATKLHEGQQVEASKLRSEISKIDANIAIAEKKIKLLKNKAHLVKLDKWSIVKCENCGETSRFSAIKPVPRSKYYYTLQCKCGWQYTIEVDESGWQGKDEFG